MKPITGKTSELRSTAFGGANYVYVQRFEVEESDVGFTKDHFGGHNYSHITFTKSDVGKIVEVMSDNRSWSCWGFVA